MKAKRTPGNWSVDAEHPKGALAVRAEDGTVIVLVRYGRGSGITYERAGHNAKFISAAPKMYEALKTVQKLIKSAIFNDPDERLRVWKIVHDTVGEVEIGPKAESPDDEPIEEV